MVPTPTLDLELLRAFATVVQSGSFSAAAERLMRGQSAVSLQIKRLEDRVGARLLDRGPRHLSVTAKGEVVLAHAKRMLDMNDALISQLRDPDLSGAVRFGAPEDFATSHLPDVLSRFALAYPKVTLEVTCELTLDLQRRFDAGGLDLALVKRAPERRSADEGREVWHEPLVWVAGPVADAAARDTLPLVVSPEPCVYRRRATDALEAAGRPWRVAYTCASLAGNHAAVRAGLGLTVLPADMVPDGFTVIAGGRHGLPDLPDTEIALIAAPRLSAPAARLRDVIIAALEGAG